MSDDFDIIPSHPRCRHLLSKGILMNAGMPAGEEVCDDEGNFWCSNTQREFGPDDQFVDDAECRDPSRSCYEPPQ